MDIASRPNRADYFLVGLFTFILFGYAGISGRPLTMHEARLPQTSREMKAAGEWLLPHSGIRPWLERPPLPHWIVIASMTVFQRDDSVWVVRLPSAVMGLGTVLLTMWMAGVMFGRTIGVLSGLVLATSFEFYQYSSLAEDDVYLAALVAICMALVVRAEFLVSKENNKRENFINSRRWEVPAMFAVLGLANIAKGPLLAILMVAPAIGVYALWNAIAEHHTQALRRYTWLWGWLIMLAIAAAWPMWAYHRYPDVLDNWKYDYLGRVSGEYSDINQPWYYYGGALALGALPWTLFCLIGIVDTARLIFSRSQVEEQTRRSLRFVWCWAIAPVVVLSIPQGKHHHYLVPLMAPWAMLGAFGLTTVGRLLNVQGWRGAIAMGITLSLLLVGYCIGESVFAAKTDHTVNDTAFLLRARQEVPPDAPLYINAKLGKVGNLDFFRIQFYSRPDAVLLHNLSYLRDEKIKARQVYVITRARDEGKLKLLGEPVIVDQSEQSHDIAGPEGRFTLFKLTFDPNLRRYPAPQHITSLQAMERDLSGPWCGPAL
jgi:4-amino-4-deoxy-L-arabinose transferase-like glycosyltransferase